MEVVLGTVSTNVSDCGGDFGGKIRGNWIGIGGKVWERISLENESASF